MFVALTIVHYVCIEVTLDIGGGYTMLDAESTKRLGF